MHFIVIIALNEFDTNHSSVNLLIDSVQEQKQNNNDEKNPTNNIEDLGGLLETNQTTTQNNQPDGKNVVPTAAILAGTTIVAALINKSNKNNTQGEPEKKIKADNKDQDKKEKQLILSNLEFEKKNIETLLKKSEDKFQVMRKQIELIANNIFSEKICDDNEKNVSKRTKFSIKVPDLYRYSTSQRCTMVIIIFDDSNKEPMFFDQQINGGIRTIICSPEVKNLQILPEGWEEKETCVLVFTGYNFNAIGEEETAQWVQDKQKLETFKSNYKLTREIKTENVSHEDFTKEVNKGFISVFFDKDFSYNYSPNGIEILIPEIKLPKTSKAENTPIISDLKDIFPTMKHITDYKKQLEEIKRQIDINQIERK